MRLNAKWESLLHPMRKTILLMPTDPSSEAQSATQVHLGKELEEKLLGRKRRFYLRLFLFAANLTCSLLSSPSWHLLHATVISTAS